MGKNGIYEIYLRCTIAYIRSLKAPQRKWEIQYFISDYYFYCDFYDSSTIFLGTDHDTIVVICIGAT